MGRTRRLTSVLLMAACSGTVEEPVQVGTVEVNLPAGGNAVPGQTVQLTAVVRDPQGGIIATPPEIAWSSADRNIAHVSATGLVTAVGVGTVNITAVSAGVPGARSLVIDQGGMVGAAGGTVTAYVGGVVLTVPPNAFTAPTPIRVGPIVAPPPDPSFIRQSGARIDFTGTAAQPITLALSYDPSLGPIGVPPAQYAVRILQNGAWVSLTGGSVNGTARVASSPITTAGSYGVGRRPADTPCVAPPHRQFDFRIGNWSWAGPAGLTGDAQITAETGGCALLEVLRLSNGTESRALFFFEPAAALWYYTSVTGSNLTRLSGGIDGDRMILYTAARTTRVVWHAPSPTVHTQTGEAGSGNTWTVQGAGTYTKR